MLDCVQRRGSQEDRTAEEMANGTAGAPNPCGRYFGLLETLDERLIRQGFAVLAATPGCRGEHRRLRRAAPHRQPSRRGQWTFET
jgi:hypothetical protein